MKKIGLMILLVLLSMMFAGCGQKKSLTVYVVETDALYRQAVKGFAEEYTDQNVEVVSFESYEQMEEQLSAELLSGKGPDVLLFNSRGGGTDPYKLSQSGAVLVLDDFVSGLSQDGYFTQILDAGKMDEKQYFIPLSWNIMQAYSTKETMENKGYYNEDFYQSLTSEFQELEDDENHYTASTQFGSSRGLMNYLLEVAGYSVFDQNSGQLVMKKDRVEETAALLKLFYDEAPKRREINVLHKNDFAGAMQDLTFFLEYYPFMHNLRYYQSSFPDTANQEMYYIPVPRRDGSGVNARVIQYGAINANSENKESAWLLLSYILDQVPANMGFNKYETENVYYAPLNKASSQGCIVTLSNSYVIGATKRCAPLNEENALVLQEMPSKVVSAVIPNAAIDVLMQECMNPYLNSEDTFDNCYEELLERLELYIGE